MASTPPRVNGTPDLAAYHRWLEERLDELGDAVSVTTTRVEAVQGGLTNAGNVAADAAIQGREMEPSTIGPDSNNRLARPIVDADYWKAVIAGTRKVFEVKNSNGDVIESSTARNVSYNPAGVILMNPVAGLEAAELTVTGVNPVPPSLKIYIEAAYPIPTGQPEIWIEWRNTDGTFVQNLESVGFSNPQLVTSGSVVSVPVSAGGTQWAYAYTVKLVRPMDSGTGYIVDPKIFESVGKDGLSVSPGGISVEDANGNKTTEINPSLPLLAAPTSPILTSSVGSVSVRWNGSLTTGVAPAHLDYVFAEESVNGTSGWVRVGQALKRAGDIVTRPPVGSTRFYRLTAVDTSGRASTQSLAQSIVVAGVDIPDLAGDIGDVIETVDGLNKIFFEAKDNPPTAHANGDLWFVVDPASAIVVEVMSWNGSVWVPYRLVADSIIVPGSLGTITLADGAITAPKVAAKSLTAEQIQAGSLGVDVLTPNIGSQIDISINPEIADLQDGLEQQAIRFRFDSAGLHIGEPDTDDELRLSPGRIEMVQGGAVPTWWEAQTFYVERMIVDAANIANHRWENGGAGKTILRPL